jgi:hypothetical protein
MEFHAYCPSHAQSPRASRFWKVQRALHDKDSLLLPGALLFAAATFVLLEHWSPFATQAKTSNTVRNFLALVLLSMIPLAFLEKKILACPDPLSTISKFSEKLMISHAVFFAMRLPEHYRKDGIVSGAFLFPFGSVLAVCVLLPACFRIRSARALFRENREVWGIVLFGVIAATMEEVARHYATPKWMRMNASGLVSAIVAQGALNLELVAFAPAVVAMVRSPEKATQKAQEVDVADTRSRTLVLFACLLGFYFHEDIRAAFELWRLFPLLALAHVAHYALLLDFAGFVLAHLCDPAKVEKLMGALRDIFAEASQLV